jgi:hypothetical protein
MSDAEQNVVWNLFSGERERIATAFQRLQPRLQSWSSVLNTLLRFYGLEGMAMPYTMEDLKREVEERILHEMSPEKLLAHLTPEQRLEGLSLEEIVSYLKKKKAAQSNELPEPPGSSQKESS